MGKREKTVILQHVERMGFKEGGAMCRATGGSRCSFTGGQPPELPENRCSDCGYTAQVIGQNKAIYYKSIYECKE
jgi:hypothetical protein